jgi:hypothetical protein
VVVLRNWKEILLPVMRATFAIELSADKLALLVGGDSEVRKAALAGAGMPAMAARR